MALWRVVTVTTQTSRYVVEADSAHDAENKVAQGRLTDEELQHMADLGTDPEEVILVEKVR